MSAAPIHKQKRFFLSAATLLTGVAFAGVLAAVMGTPEGKASYLHEHLSALQAVDNSAWESSRFALSPADKAKIETIIHIAERRDLSGKAQDVLTGQALQAQRQMEAACAAASPSCPLPVRINRRLRTEHVNQDFRVANVKETSLRVDFKTQKNTGELKFQGLYEETRTLRFYQTQGGWVHNSSEIIEAISPQMGERSHKFKDKFANDFIGLNYYPASASWRDFWAEFPLLEIQTDIERAQALNVNALRIFLDHDYFDALETREDGLVKLQAFLDLCESRNIDVLVTLFDLRPNYALSNWGADIEHIDAVLSVVGAHEAILGIDVKNQADLDFESWGEGIVEGWLTVMARHIQTQYPDLAVTAGWSKAENATRLMDVVDVVTYHEYQNPKGLAERLQSITAAAGGKPVMITELGSTIWKPPFVQSFGEAAQASRLNAQLNQTRQANGVFVWTLNDFDEVGREIVGPLPWRRAQQKHYGLLRADGSERPSAQILKAFGNRPKLRRSKSRFKYSKLSTQ